MAECQSGRHGGLMVSVPGWGLRRGRCVVFLGKTLYFHSASLHPGVSMGTSKTILGGGVPCNGLASHPGGGGGGKNISGIMGQFPF